MQAKAITKFMNITIIAVLLSIPFFHFCEASEGSEPEPLFPINLNHEFPRASESFEEIKGLIINNYYSDKITEEALYWAAIKGMLRFISPPEDPDLARIWTPEEYDKVFQTLQGVEVSIGIKSNLNPQEGSLTITDILTGSPSEGVLKPMDRILRINSEVLKNKSVEEINSLLSGEEGKDITLTVNRDIEVFDVSIKRRKFETETIITSKLTDKVLFVEIKGFTSGISKILKDELSRYNSGGVDNLIIDLRNNPGGLFGEALRIVELFLPEKSIILRTIQRESGLQNYVSSNKAPFHFDMAILINEKTASSAEILAAALQDHQKALLIGTGTYGKGVFDTTFTLKNEFHVRFITGAMYSPKGKSWQSKGITPDFLVNQDDDTLRLLMKLNPKERFNKDLAMITAFKLLRHSQQTE